MSVVGDMLDVRFFVPGVPVPKGNHSAFPIARGKCPMCKPGRPCRARNCFGGVLVGTVLTDKGAGELEAWQQLTNVLAMSARNAAAQRLVEPPGAVAVSLVFVLQRPEGHWTDAGKLTPEGRRRVYPTVKPDGDKLERATCDGLTGSLVHDDAQLIISRRAKVYAPWRGKSGVAVHARRMSTLDAWIEHELSYHGLTTPVAQAELL